MNQSKKEDNKLLSDELSRLDVDLLELMYHLPNIPNESLLLFTFGFKPDIFFSL